MQTEPHQNSFRRTLRWVFLVTAATTTLVVVVILIVRATYHGSIRQIHEEMAELGYPRDFEALVEHQAGEGAGTNGGPMLLEAVRLMASQNDSEFYGFIPYRGEDDYPPFGQAFDPQIVEQLEKFLRRHEDVRELTLDALQSDVVRIPVDSDALLQEFSAFPVDVHRWLRSIGRLLADEVILAAEHGEPERSLQLLRATYDLGVAIQSQPDVSVQMMGVSVSSMAANNVPLLLGRYTWTDDQLVEMAHVFRVNPSREAIVAGIWGDALAGAEAMRRSWARSFLAAEMTNLLVSDPSEFFVGLRQVPHWTYRTLAIEREEKKPPWILPEPRNDRVVRTRCELN